MSIFNEDYQVIKEKLLCPRCKESLSVNEILDNCSISWPLQNWIYLTCPICNKTSHVEVTSNKLVTGELDGVPGPSFFSLF